MKRIAWDWVVLVASVAVGGAVPAWAQTVIPVPTTNAATIVEPPAPLLPTNDRLAAKDTAAKIADKPELSQVMIEDGLKRTETRAAMNGAGDASASVGWVRAYQFLDATGAFSAYTYFRQGGRRVGNAPGGSEETILPSGEMVLLSGVSVVLADLKRVSEAEALLAGIVSGLPKMSGHRGVPPLLPTLFPKSGYEAATLRYALGPVSYQAMGGMLPAEILGWDKSAEVGTASYSGRGGKGTLTLLMFPTPQIAGIVGRAIEQAVNQRPGAMGMVKLRRIGPLVAMTSGGFGATQAEALVGSVQLNQEVTFDKKQPPEFHAEVKKTATLLQSIAVFTGLLIVAALVLGVFLGGARAGIRVLQGKPAASEPEFLTIDLSGPPAPLPSSPSSSSDGESA